ncbi:MAG: helix-hairpin-helix domain-containing protein [bacterium]|uniref:Competence protein n=1 Tax=candidate division TA06 bacterium 34_109 TaxID=1635277 RepID=A0A101I1G6_UNCT6|nr:MAG: Competence protein [candidate division TA06 bacterium 32_111]KUK86654.1 MAG: Competence protein [candidate division TA06 bacterium 34_109]MDI6699904.1 helix-hairpin-helix domain-containing protein [bacterium]
MKQYMTDRLFFLLSLLILFLSFSLYFFDQKVENKKALYEEVNLESRKNSFEKYELNSVTFEQLVGIPGIGEKTAEKILKSRDSLGGFKKIEDLLVVHGINKKKLENLKEYLYVDESR